MIQCEYIQSLRSALVSLSAPWGTEQRFKLGPAVRTADWVTMHPIWTTPHPRFSAFSQGAPLRPKGGIRCWAISLRLSSNSSASRTQQWKRFASEKASPHFKCLCSVLCTPPIFIRVILWASSTVCHSFFLALCQKSTPKWVWTFEPVLASSWRRPTTDSSTFGRVWTYVISAPEHMTAKNIASRCTVRGLWNIKCIYT